MQTVKLILKTLKILLKVFLFFLFIWVGFWLLDRESDIFNILGVIIIVLDIVITIRHLIIKSKGIYLTFKQKQTNEQGN